MPKHDETDRMLTAALAHAERGWRVFPNSTPTFDDDGTTICSCGRGAKCPERSRGKHPRIREWQKRATTNQSQIRRWWDTWPETNIGIATGWDSDLIVLDVDAGEGDSNLERILAEGNIMPDTVTAITGGGGRQFYFNHRNFDFDPPNKSRLCGLGGIDIRCDGGQVVAPPSLHRSGQRYRWADGRSPDEIHLADPPDWLVDMLRQDGKPRSTPRRPRGATVPLPAAHIEHLHPQFSPRLVTTRSGTPRRVVTAALRNEWIEQAAEFETESTVIGAICHVWLPPVMRYIPDHLHEHGVLNLVHSYETTTPGGSTRLVQGGELVHTRFGSGWDPSIADTRLWMRLLLGQLRIAVPWRGHRRNTILIPVHMFGEQGPIDLWSATPEGRAQLIEPFVDAINKIEESADTGLSASYWAEGMNELWIAIHATESHHRDILLQLRSSIVDLAVRIAPRVAFHDEVGRPWPGSRSTGRITHRIGLGNATHQECPVPFAFHPEHPDRMMMAFDPETGGWVDQIPHLLAIARRSLAPVIEILPDLEQETQRHHDARRRALKRLFTWPDRLSPDEAVDAMLGMLRPVFDEELKVDGVGFGVVGDRTPPEQQGACDTNSPGVGDTAAHPRGFPLYGLDTSTSKQQRQTANGERHSPTHHTTPQPHTPTPTHTPPSSQLGAVFVPNRWRSLIPDEILGLHSALIDNGSLARVLAAMRDAGLLDGASPGQSILIDLENIIVERYTGSESADEIRSEIRRYLQTDLARLDELYDPGVRLPEGADEHLGVLAEQIRSQLPRGGRGAPPSTDAIVRILRVIALKAQGGRRASWKLDIVAVQAGWAENIGTDDHIEIREKDRKRVGRFIARICEHYWRDSLNRIRPEQKSPIIALLRRERRGNSGVSSLYTVIWENWGPPFSELAANPCPPARSDDDPIQVMRDAGIIT